MNGSTRDTAWLATCTKRLLAAALACALVSVSACQKQDAEPEGPQASTSGEASGQTNAAETNGAETNGAETNATHMEAGQTEAGLAEEGADQVVSDEDLQAEIARHQDASPWHFGPRPDGVPEGTWQLIGGGEDPLVFRPDGTFSCRFGDRQGRPRMAHGRYAISDQGLVVAVAYHGTTRLGLFYRYDSNQLTGSRGPQPQVHWKRSGPASRR